MNRFLRTVILLIITALPAFSMTVRRSYTDIYTPVYMSYEDLRSSFAVLAPRELTNPGKIYVKDTFLFISEKNRGIHIIDNKNPASPVKICFLTIPGNLDIAVKDSTLYADSYVDLVVVDLGSLFRDSSSKYIKEIKRIEDIFPYEPVKRLDLTPIHPRAWSGRIFNEIDRTKGVVVEWEISRKTSLHVYPYGVKFSAGNSGGGSGTGGSMARFTIRGDFLYTVNWENMQIFSIKETKNPKYWSEFEIGEQIETIFPYGEYLFIGSKTGIYIYTIIPAGDKPGFEEKPRLISQLEHVRSYDPVVVEGTTAYVTLRDFWAIGGELIVIDISDIENPAEIETYPMRDPYGLGTDKNTLFVCDEGTVKIYSTTNPKKLKMITTLENAENGYAVAYDLIPINNLLIVTTQKGIIQYDYSNIKKIKKLSVIK